LSQRLGRLPRGAQQQVRALSTEQLEALSDVLMQFGDRSELQQWLKEHA